MVDRGAELIKPKATELKLGGDFTLFNPSTTRFGTDVDGEGRKYLEVLSDDRTLHLSDNFPKVEVSVVTPPHRSSGLEFTPFTPEKGYVITDLDHSLDSKQRRVDEKNFSDWTDLPFAPLGLYIGIGNNSLDNNEEYFKLLTRLRLQLSFPQAVFEGRTDPDFIKISKEGRQWLSNFYPIETGPIPSPIVPLPGDKNVVSADSFGHSILLPEDRKLLEQIRATFYLSGDQTVSKPRGLIKPGPFIPKK